jgi:hypothetical protein
MNKKKEFNMDRYEEIKKLLADNKVSSFDLDKYIEVKALRYARHKQENTLNDDEIIARVNGEE